MDMKFEPLVDEMEEVLINTTAAKEHVRNMERKIRELKKKGCCTLNELSFKHCMPCQAIIHLVYFVVLWINGFPSANDVLDVYVPKEMITGMKLDFQKHCRVRSLGTCGNA
jgi:hypothetical protein